MKEYDVTTADDFGSRTDPYRDELLAHCYRMLGSVHDAEDLLQETMLRAWRAYDRFDENRASLRTWLYRIATNACLTALEGRGRRPLPSGIGTPDHDPEQDLVPGHEVPWLQPFPLSDPAVVLDARNSLRLALVAAMQHLPARQRAVLILRDVLDWSAAEVAEALETTTAAVNSALQRARARLGAAGVYEDDLGEPDDPERRAVLDRYVAAFEKGDVEALRRLLTDDVILEMPPFLSWFKGPQACGTFLTRLFARVGTDFRLVTLTANGQPAAAVYGGAAGRYRLNSLQVFTITASGVRRITVFRDQEVLAAFGLAGEL
ncbi:sigma-70 family RNA polymerase sigma factor [Streptosporangiaceae bacterium NEAU-GS5]|nr:sigma-70 family RNA polymerase sigma factor [Streptosporangiaceae bacterium NEAU-GS5]